jgi:hypothetical protein
MKPVGYVLKREGNALRITYRDDDMIIPVSDVIDVRKVNSGLLGATVTIARKDDDIKFEMDLMLAKKFMEELFDLIK